MPTLPPSPSRSDSRAAAPLRPVRPVLRRHTRALWLLALWTTAVYAWNLGGGSLRCWDEALTAERSLEFLHGSHWLTPHFQGAPDFNKPPLYYWFTAFVFSIFGPGEAQARLGSALLGAGCIALVYLLARRAAGRRAGLLAAFLLATHPQWINDTREAMLDSGLICGILAGIHALLHGRGRRNLVCAGLFPAAACLLKGPGALLAFLAPPLQFAFFRPRRGWGRRWFFALILFLALSAPWFVAMSAKWGPRYVERYVRYNIGKRLTETIEGHGSSALFYPACAWRGSPLLVVLFFASAGMAFDGRRRVWRRWAVHCALGLAVLLAIQLAASKRTTYLLYVYPFPAMTAGAALDLCLRRLSPRPRVLACVILAAFCLSNFFRLYVPRMDYSASAKAVALRIKKDSFPTDRVLTVETPVNVILFYSQRPTGYTAASDLERRLRALNLDGGHSAYVVLPRKHADPARDRLRLAGRWRVETLIRKGSLAALRISTPSP